MNVGYNELGIDKKRKVIYRNFHSIDNHIYLVEISKKKMKVFIIIFPNFEKPETFIHYILTEK